MTFRHIPVHIFANGSRSLYRNENLLSIYHVHGDTKKPTRTSATLSCHF